MPKFAPLVGVKAPIKQITGRILDWDLGSEQIIYISSKNIMAVRGEEATFSGVVQPNGDFSIALGVVDDKSVLLYEPGSGWKPRMQDCTFEVLAFEGLVIAQKGKPLDNVYIEAGVRQAPDRITGEGLPKLEQLGKQRTLWMYANKDMNVKCSVEYFSGVRSYVIRYDLDLVRGWNSVLYQLDEVTFNERKNHYSSIATGYPRENVQWFLYR